MLLSTWLCWFRSLDLILAPHPGPTSGSLGGRRWRFGKAPQVILLCSRSREPLSPGGLSQSLWILLLILVVLLFFWFFYSLMLSLERPQVLGLDSRVMGGDFHPERQLRAEARAPQFIYSPTEGHLGSLQVLAIMNKAAMNICMGISFQLLWVNTKDHDCWIIWLECV